MPIKLNQCLYMQGSQNGVVTPEDDATLYDFFLKQNGFIKAPTATLLGANVLSVTDGMGIVYGRGFTISAEEIVVPLATSGALAGRLVVHIDISNAETPIEFRVQRAAILPPLVIENFFNGGTIYELEIANFSIEISQLTALKVTAETLTSHKENKNNPHGVTKAQLSLGNCENTADTNKNVATARTLATPRTIQTNLYSAAAASFNGSANIAPGITGVLGPGNGGTGYTSLQAARNAMGLGNTLSVLPVANGGTGATYAAAARENLQILVGSKVVATDVSGNVVIIAGRPSDAVNFSNGDANALPYNFSFSNFFLNGLWYVHIKNPSGAPHAYATVRINYLLIY